MKPLISLVMATRNDNYGGEVYREVEPTPPSKELDRMAMCLYTLHQAFSVINYEIIIVEWNRPKESILDYSFIRDKHVRVIEVDEQFSNQVLGTRPFHEFWAKNVGIRRARGEYIIATNPDVLWLTPIEKEMFVNQCPMRAYRWTVDRNVLNYDFDMLQIKNYCMNDTHRRNYDLNSNGDFTLLTKSMWDELQGYSIMLDQVAGCDMWHIERARRRFNRMETLPFDLYHIEHPGRPLASGYGFTSTSDDWGAPSEGFLQYTF
jgi:hypothetical protein